jgi:hypothetical protein
MPFSTTTPFRLAAKLTRCLSLALLPALTSEARALSAPQRKPSVRSATHTTTTAATLLAAPRRAQPYLAALGSLPLRFAAAPVEISDEPPKPPAPEPAETDSLAAEGQAPLPAPVRAEETLPHPPAPEPASVSEEKSPFPEPPAERPTPILPDDTPRELRAEDVLPFFRYPGGQSGSGHARPREVDVAVPFTPTHSQTPPTPPSSAIYQQK